MSWLLVLALLVIFVVRTGFSMVSRQRLRAQTGVTSPAQTVASPAPLLGAEPTAPVPAPVWQPQDAAAPDLSTSPPSSHVPQARRPVEPAATSAGEDAAPDGTETSTVAMSPELEGRVRELMDSGFEAGAVRLICDELGVGILDAQKSARAVAGLPAS
jgi:hypothetical protein